MKYKNGVAFLNKLYSNMHMEEFVMHTALKGDTPNEKIEKYLKRLERVHEEVITNEHKMELLKSFYYDKYVIKELPNNYIELQKRIAREEGHGNIEVTESMKAKLLIDVIKEQRKSLDRWLDYLCSDDAIYPMWFKYYVFQGMVKLNKFDKEKGDFAKRTKTTTEPFIELNMEALAKVYTTLVSQIGSNEATEEQAKALENGESFKKLYSYYLTNSDFSISSNETEGIWIKYDQGDNYQELLKSLQGKNTGWCTAGEETCKAQLKNGDFYVYYTIDENREYTNPRIAIRMNGKEEIREVRGIGKDQNLEDCMVDIAESKLSSFRNKYEYLKKSHDMKLLTEIDRKHKNNQQLTPEEIKFLYEIETNGNKIEGFGWTRDPRIEEIRAARDAKSDLAKLFGCERENIGISENDFEDNEIMFYYGDLSTVLIDEEKLKSLRYVSGDFIFDGKDASYLINLEKIVGMGKFPSLESSKGLEKLQEVGFAWFENLKDATGLINLQRTSGTARFPSLESAKGLENLKYIGDTAVFRNLKNAEGLGVVEILRDAIFPALESIKGLENLQIIYGTPHFDSASDIYELNTKVGFGRENIRTYLERQREVAKLDHEWKREWQGNIENIGNIQERGKKTFLMPKKILEQLKIKVEKIVDKITNKNENSIDNITEKTR